MAHELSFYRPSAPLEGAAQTITIPGANYFMLRYQPSTPQEKADGEYEDITETIEILFEGANTTAMRDALRAVERFLIAAKKRKQRNAGAKYYFRFKPHGDSVTWRSELLGGRVELGRNALTAFTQAKMEARIIITRRHYWEGDLTAIAIASPVDTTPATTGVRIGNGATFISHVSIDNAQIVGSLDAPAMIEMKNTSGATQGYRNWYISQIEAQVYDLHFEGEDAQVGHTVEVDTDSSGGDYLEVDVDLTTTVNWDISADAAGWLSGRAWRVFMRLASAPSQTVYVTPYVYDEFGVVQISVLPSEKEITSTSSRLVDLGTLRIPSGLGNVDLQAGVVLRLSARATVSTLLNIDYVFLFSTNSIRHLVQRGNTIDDDDFVIEDGIEEAAYSKEDTVKHAIYTQFESPVMLVPDLDQQICFVHDDADGDSVIDTESTIKMWYRPRLLTI